MKIYEFIICVINYNKYTLMTIIVISEHNIIYLLVYIFMMIDE